MHFSASIALLLGTAVAAFQSPHQRVPQRVHKGSTLHRQQARSIQSSHNSSYLNPKSQKFVVNGSALPEVDFDIGESYAGNLPNTPAGNSSLFFWFFPSQNPAASDEITIWLNGGPGCSSLVGLLQENGPILWQSGTYKPIRNPYSWTNLTNVVWVDQPAGTGFSPGPPTVNDETDVANQFISFWKNFVDTFALHGRKVYITGESYAGMYVPYIASGMLDKNDTKYFNVKGVQINDPSINWDDTLIQAPSVLALNHFKSVMPVNASFLAEINERADSCGYTEFMENALTYPPKGKLPTAPDSNKPGCDVWDSIISAIYDINPCFSVYHLTDFCPYLWDEMGFPSLAGGPNDYFNRSDVQAALHAPPTDYSVCGEGNILPNDASAPSALGPLPSVIERTNNTIIGHGWLDFLLFANGTLATIQNMTWNGAQGFQKPPVEPLFVPYHDGLDQDAAGTAASPFTQDAGAGYLGTAHTERGLTFSSVYLSGHEIPQYAPGAAYRQLEFLLGRINNLTEQRGYTTSS